MSCYVRLMRKEDISQVREIDREAFPTQWPPPNYKHELKNRLAYYLVACDDDKLIEQPEVKTAKDKSSSRLISRLKRWFGGNSSSNEGLSPSTEHCIAGFVGFWVMAGEAHITSIAVRKAYRRQGIGELLLISVIDMAKELKASLLTLEVRASNIEAQSLYSKYGFSRAGVRKGYYTDNREDAVVMSTENIALARFQTQFQRLKEAHSKKWGIDLYKIAR